MADVNFAQTSFLGGEVSKSIQGRFDLPAYRTWMNVCINGFPTETGMWTRRPGFQFAGTTRSGAAGRELKFDHQATAPYNMEFTDDHLRFRNGPTLVTMNDGVLITSISTANPAVIETAAITTWATGDQVYCSELGTTSPLLQNRVFEITVVDTTHFSIADAVTGDPIDGSTLGWAATTGATVNRVLDFVTPYTTAMWSTLRSVQTETTAFLLTATQQPYAVVVSSQPTDDAFAQFTFSAANFKDGPYLDPLVGSIASPSAQTGLITLTLSFQAYSATQAYSTGDFVTSASINYQSLSDANVGNTPASSPTKWEVVSAGAAVGPNGFVSTDIGRLVRLLSEPPVWAVGTTYAAKDPVAFGTPATYWTSLVAGNIGNQPGSDLTKWQLNANVAAWTWGKITAMSTSGIIDRNLTGSVHFGDTGWTQLNNAFDGVTSQASAQGAFMNDPIAGQYQAYIGTNFSGATAQTISSAVVYGSSDAGICGIGASVTLNLRGKHTVPATSADGTLLGTLGPFTGDLLPKTITSSDTTTAWEYVWIEIISNTLLKRVAEVVLFSATSVAGTAVTVEILGDALVYSTACRTWRLGVYSDTTGWPTCGTYHEGRLWLSGAVPNRIDASMSNEIRDGAVNFAPTTSFGAVAANNGITYTFNAPDANPIFWMIPDLQGIICGTKAGEWLVQPPTAGAITPLNIAARRVTAIGCANIEPRRTDHTTVFVQKFGRKVMEYFPDIYSGKFSAPHLSFTWKHLTVGGIDELAYQQELSPTVWARVSGTLIGCTYKRDTLASAQGPNIAGGHRHTLGSGRTVESLCVGPSIDGTLDSLSIVTNDEATGIRHVEIMTSIVEEGADLADCWFLDDAVAPSSITSSTAPVTDAPYGGLTINGLWHLNAATVAVFADGMDCGDFIVTDGSVFVPYGDSIAAGTGSGLFAAMVAATATIVVGFTYTSDGQIVRPATPQEAGTRLGPALAKIRRSDNFGILVDNSAGLTIGSTFDKLDPVLFKDDAGRALTVGNTYSGVTRTTLSGDYGFDGMLCWRITRPLPTNIMAVGSFLNTADF